MPVQDGNYVAPEWVNGQPPAINSQELNAISETLENDWRRNEVLTANTAQVFGLQSDATPDQVFTAIANQFAKTLSVTVTVDGTPVSGVTVEGIQQEDGSLCVTDSSGKTSGICATSSTTITAISPFVDVDNVSKVVDTTSVSTNTSIEMTSKSSGNITVKSSKQMRFSPSRTSVTYFIVGGGASGCAGRCNYFSSTHGVTYCIISGAGGGYTKTGTVNPGGQNISVRIGGGGGAVTAEQESSSSIYIPGIAGGATSIAGSFGTITADGGKPGSCTWGKTYLPSKGLTGGAGGSGGGGAYFETNSNIYAGNGGSNGSNGCSNGANPQTPTGQNFGGTGQGTTTTFDGMTFSAGGSGMIAMPDGNAVATPASGAGTNLYTESSSGTAGSATTHGSAGGWAYTSYLSTDMSVTSGAGGRGCAIFKWTT